MCKLSCHKLSFIKEIAWDVEVSISGIGECMDVLINVWCMLLVQNKTKQNKGQHTGLGLHGEHSR